MSASRGTAEGEGVHAEPLPCCATEDAKGWRIAGVGKRHPRWLEFEIGAIAYRHDPIGLACMDTPPDEYSPEARVIAEELRGWDPAATTSEDVRRLVHATFVRMFDPKTAGDEPAYSALAEEIREAWRQHATRQAQPTPP